MFPVNVYRAYIYITYIHTWTASWMYICCAGYELHKCPCTYSMSCVYICIQAEQKPKVPAAEAGRPSEVWSTYIPYPPPIWKIHHWGLPPPPTSQKQKLSQAPLLLLAAFIGTPKILRCQNFGELTKLVGWYVDMVAARISWSGRDSL